MDQKDFNSYVIPELLLHFPFFKEKLRFTQDDVAYIEYASKKGTVKLLISTRDREITIGFAAGKDLFDWHIHMEMLGAETKEQIVVVATELIKEILSDRKIICLSSHDGYFIPWDDENMEVFKQEGEIITNTYWSLL